MPKKVLVVEDSPTQAAQIHLDFEQRNFIVYSVHTGQDGLVSARQYSPDIIVLDLNLPDSSGLEVCKALKKDVNLRSALIVIYSCDSNPNNMLKAYSAGADYYVEKNSDSMGLLSNLIDTVLTRKAQHARLIA